MDPFKILGVDKLEDLYTITSESPQKDFPILKLPREIQLAIFENCPPKTLKSIRLAHPHLKDPAAAVLFRKWTLSLSLYTKPQPINRYHFASGGGHRWLDKREISRRWETTLPPAESQLKAIQNAYYNGSNDELQMLFDNVQEIEIVKYDVYEGYPDNNAMAMTWPRYAPWGVEVLKGFLEKMKKLRSIDWQMPAHNLDVTMTSPSLRENVTHLSWTRVPDFEFIGKSPERSLAGFAYLYNVTHLDFKLANIVDLNGFHYFPNLKNLTLECTVKTYNIVTFLNGQAAPFKLRSLTLKNDTRGITFPDEIFQKYLSNLQTLNMITPEVEIEQTKNNLAFSRNPFDGNAKSIWTHFMENGIYLSNINTFGQSRDLIKYLLSYPQPRHALKSFEIRVWPYITNNLDDPRNFVHTLWHQVIPFHRRTLKRIAIYPEARSVVRGGNYHGAISWQGQEALGKELSNFPTPHTGLFTLNDDIKTVLKSCEKLEALEMGSLNWNGAAEFLRFVLFQLPRRVRNVGFYMDGWSRKTVGWDYVGSSGAHYAREFADNRHPLIEEVWDYKEEWGVHEDVLDDWTWKRLNIKFVPICQRKKLWFVGGGGKSWKLMDSELEKEICNMKNETQRGWRSVDDVLGGEEDLGYDVEAIFRDAVWGNRYDPAWETEKQEAVFARFRRAAENVRRAREASASQRQ
ncbi:hypothetical protein AOL_s00097g242 [Orbilia oligospora ATCC 24927]|uniref:F-box domain-containing protein n=1 Tax=Arthrobotrys oligospora (strain ATCC 24927 / CBS 115.81 / DSM 1491) TaxID=756982 RepID=G1XIR5_ARTOA|nr:hypothetical protein AOL_s00097g242 [Orbilia oligospora ATCC 24927]EGX46816.1 hypothetical protein AOL_s00097g242 [Orbilia oligospora ATCC 24927]